MAHDAQTLTIQLGSFFNFVGKLKPIVTDKSSKSTGLKMVCPTCAADNKAVQGSQCYKCPSEHVHPTSEMRRAKPFGTGKDMTLKLVTDEMVKALADAAKEEKSVLPLTPYPFKSIAPYLESDGTSYLFEPQMGAQRAFSLLREFIEDSEVVFCGVTYYRGTERWAWLQAVGGNVILRCSYWPNQIVPLPAPVETSPVSEVEHSMMENLVKSLTQDFNPSNIHSLTRETHEAIAEALASGTPPEAVEVAPKIDTSLEAMLAASLAQLEGEGS